MISLILPSYRRPELLNLGLWSLSKQFISYDLEIIVLNEGGDKETEGVCAYYSTKFNLRHILSNPSGQKRNVIFASNIGIKQAIGDIIILSCPEMFHIYTESINSLIKPLIQNKKLIVIPEYILFDKGEIKKYLSLFLRLEIPDCLISALNVNDHNKYSATCPFFMALYKQEAIDIGGYDEDFIGIAGEDDDFTQRLIANGLQYFRTKECIIHLYHPKSFDESTKLSNEKYLYNKQLLKNRKDIIIRNRGKEWGILEI